MYIEEAFKRLNLLEDDYSYSEDQQLELLSKAVSDDIDDIPEEEIIDVDAETCDDLQDNYIGKIIIECDCCHARLYKDPEDLVLGSSEDGVELFNIEEECPVCHTNSGFRVIGKIEQYSDDAIKPEEPEEEHEEPTEEDDEFEKEVHEALQEALNPGECVAVLNKNEFDETGDAEAIAAKIESDYIPGNEVFDTLNVSCEVKGDNIFFTGPKVDIDTLYNRMFNDEITPDYVECATEESEEEPEETVEFDSREDAEKYFNDHREELGYDSVDEWLDSDVEKINEALDSVKVITDDGEVTVENDDDKLVVDLSSGDVDEDVEPEPTNEDDNPDEMIAPLTDEEEDDILNTAELNAEEAGENEGEFEEPEPLEEPEPFEEPEPELGAEDEEPAEEEAEEEEVEESLHEALSDKLKAKLAAMTHNKEESEEDPVGESLTEDKDEEPLEEDDEESEHSEEEDKEEPFEDDDEEEVEHFEDKDDVSIECLEDFNESTFNKICESYLRRVYENVNTFNCTAVKNRDNKLIVEGTIEFVSGNKKQTAFEFTNPVVTKRGKVVLEGLNKTFTNTQNAYILKGHVENKEFISESMIYRYTAKTLNESNQPESVKFYGRVVCK